jgi:hypothetical protein
VTLLRQSSPEEVRTGAGFHPDQRAVEVGRKSQKLLAGELLLQQYLAAFAECDICRALAINYEDGSEFRLRDEAGGSDSNFNISRTLAITSSGSAAGFRSRPPHMPQNRFSAALR